MPILASLTDKDGVIKGALVIAEIQHPDSKTDLLQLFDDGNHSDGNAKDGIYGNLYARTTAGSTVGADTENNPAAAGVRGSYLAATWSG